MSISTRPIAYEDSLTMPENRLEEIVNGESRIMPAELRETLKASEEIVAPVSFGAVKIDLRELWHAFQKGWRTL